MQRYLVRHGARHAHARRRAADSDNCTGTRESRAPSRAACRTLLLRRRFARSVRGTPALRARHSGREQAEGDSSPGLVCLLRTHPVAPLRCA